MEKATAVFQGGAIEFESMVNTLFKTNGMHNEYEGLMHAAIGVSGEVAELIVAMGREDHDNLQEELGDLEFYIAAVKICAQIGDDNLQLANSLVMRQNHALFNVRDGLIVVAGDILDLAKRCWVYGSLLDEKKQEITNKVALLMHYLDIFYENHSYDVKDIRKSNMNKLIGPNGRFRDRVYTDKAAIARADKQEEKA